MSLYLRSFLALPLLCSAVVCSQTVLQPGDISVVGVVTDMSGCGLPADSDEISFVCYQDIQTGTAIDVTDNGWEVKTSGLWGDTEGTLQILRTGGVVPKGTVITLQGTFNGISWEYKIISPDNEWNIIDLNAPGGPFNLEAGGDQVYFLQGGTWENHGIIGDDDAEYDGRVITAFNTIPVWMADGTTHHSNLHALLLPCFYVTGTGDEFIKYAGPLAPGFVFDWIERIRDISKWVPFADCISYSTSFPPYSSGWTIDAEVPVFGLSCTICERCPPFEGQIFLSLPPGTFDLVYTDGVDTFEVFNIMDNGVIVHTITQSVDFWIISASLSGGCPISIFTAEPVSFIAPFMDPGLDAEWYICENHPTSIDMFDLLGGTPEPGGVWTPFLFNGSFYTTFLGPGKWRYIQQASPNCPPAIATVSIYFSNAEGTIIDVGCDQNGTPNNITDDVTVLTITAQGNNFGTRYGVSTFPGTITPGLGLTGVPSVFYLPPGSATGPNRTLYIENVLPPPNNLGSCVFPFLIQPPGFCSDPCDHSMEASIWGDEKVCAFSCTLTPAQMYVEVQGGTPPYIMDFRVSAPLFPSWTFTDIPIGAIYDFEVCVDTAVSQPVFNQLSRLLILPNYLTGSNVTISLMDVRDFYQCSAILDFDATSLHLYPLPAMDTISLTMCRDEAIRFDLTPYNEVINPFYDVQWYDGVPLVWGDPISNPNFANLNLVVQLWALVEDEYCINRLQMPLTIHPAPDIDSLPPIELCAGEGIALNSIPIIDKGHSMAGYRFYSGLPFDSASLISTAFFTPTDSMMVYLLAYTEHCFDTVDFPVYVQDYPDFIPQATPCDLASNTWALLFTSTADSVSASFGTIAQDTSGSWTIANIPNDSLLTITLLNATGLCADTFVIMAPNCNCPFMAQPVAVTSSFAICEGEDPPLIMVEVEPGFITQWFTQPAGGTPFLQNSNVFQPAGLASETYFVQALDTLTGCYSFRTQISLTVHISAILQPAADPVLCQGETLSLGAFTPQVVNGVNGAGQWFDLATNQPVSNPVQPQNGQGWYYVFSSAPGNCQSSDTIFATVHPLPGISLYEVLCDENTLTFSLYFTSDAEDIQASAGDLSQVAGTDSFSLENIPFNTAITFTLNNTSTGCSNTILQPAPDCDCPDLLQQATYEVCTGTGSVDLSVFEGFNVSGAWQLAGTPGGSNPATLSGNIFSCAGADPGLYVLRFIRSVILADCVDTAFFEMTLYSSPFADAGTDATVCAPDNILLNGLAGGSNLQLSWQANGSGGFSNPGALNAVYTPSLADITAGAVTFTLTATDATGFCPPAQDVVTVMIDGSSYYILQPATLTYCDTSDISVDLDEFISFGYTGGEWFFPDTVDAEITGNSLLNPSTMMAGVYTVFYTTSNAVPPCDNDTSGITVIIENCSCPSLAIMQPSEILCHVSGSFNLQQLLITTEPGVWSITGTPSGTRPASITGSVFATNLSDPGRYTIRYTLSNPVTGCDDFTEVQIDVIETPQITVETKGCTADLQSWEAVISTGGALTSTAGVISSLGGNRYRIHSIPLNTGITLTASGGSGLCRSDVTLEAPDCDCTLTISNLPDEAVLCPGENIVYTAVVTGGKGNVTSFWIVPGDSLFQLSLQVTQAGAYRFVSFDALGCREEHTVTVSFYEEMSADITSLPVTCPGDRDGAIILHGIVGGNSPYFISLNQGASIAVAAFPFSYNDLAQGNYRLDIADQFGCRITVYVQVDSGHAESVNLGPDRTLLLGDSILIDPVLSFLPDSFSWSGDLAGIDPLRLQQWLLPSEDVTLILTVFDDDGCRYSDELHIRVTLKSSIYMPNVFSPNGDGINDRICPFTDGTISRIAYFEIYSRWGELMYSVRNIVPPQGEWGWDGTMRNEQAMPGVYVYRIEAINTKGRILQLYGDLTLVR